MQIVSLFFPSLRDMMNSLDFDVRIWRETVYLSQQKRYDLLPVSRIVLTIRK